MKIENLQIKAVPNGWLIFIENILERDTYFPPNHRIYVFNEMADMCRWLENSFPRLKMEPDK